MSRRRRAGTLPVMPPPELLQHDGQLVRIVADGDASEGAYALLEVRAPFGAGLPHHVHQHEDETVHVLDGRLDVTVDGRTQLVGPGGSVRLPRGVPHRVLAASAEARFLVVCVPAGLEAFVRATGDRVGPGATPSGARLALDDDLAALLAVAGLRFLPHLPEPAGAGSVAGLPGA
jgi:quercetin dioxygenase-like cupin family protein